MTNCNPASMRDETLNEYIGKMNDGSDKELIFIKPISPTVDYAKVWEKIPEPSDKIVFPDGPFCMYFIRNELGVYVAVVLDMQNDLHVYVRPEHRKKGYLTKALKNSILPHLFEEREEQRITITEGSIGETNFGASQKVALSLGFKKMENNEYVLSADDFEYASEELIKQSFNVTEDRMLLLKRRMNYVAKSLWMIQTEVEMSYNDSLYAEELKEIVDNLRGQAWNIEGSWMKRKGR